MRDGRVVMGYGEAIAMRQTIARYFTTADGQRYLHAMLAPAGGADYANHYTAIAAMQTGDLYAVESHARALIDIAAEALPLEQAIPPTLLPSSIGVVWLDRPIPTFWSELGQQVGICALSWGIMVAEDARLQSAGNIGTVHLYTEKPPPTVASNIVIGCWCKIPVPAGTIQRPPLLWFSCSVVPSSSLAALQEIDPDTSFLEPLRFMVTFWLFIQQRILIPRSQHADRATARRLARQGDPVQSPVNVVVLRHADRPDATGQGQRTVEWRYQWLVRGHWRQQYYPSSDEHRPVWILPHVKGPDEKPLKPPRETAFAVVR